MDMDMYFLVEILGGSLLVGLGILIGVGLSDLETDDADEENPE